VGLDPTRRFSSRVDAYARYRPSYPAEIVPLLARECALSGGSVVADVGCGTGLLAKLFLDFGCRVIGIEPNPEMRGAGDRFLSAYDKFSSVDARAERTGLEDASVDLVAAGQAFHWFDAVAARREFLRILRPPGWVVLIWNEREVPERGFLRGYEDLLNRYAAEYGRVDHRRIDRERLAEFYGHTRWKLATFLNAQQFDLTGVRGRLESSSYSPRSDTPAYQPMMAELEQLFTSHQVNGLVPFVYETKVYHGCL
jgi:SAM-dependent methyltransferase